METPRHGDIEDMLKTIAFLHHHKFRNFDVKRVYFGNWLRDYSQAMDVGTLSKVQADTIRILVWVLSFLTFGYATDEFEVTSERLGVYRPEEHVDNPRHYADDKDARENDPRLRGPVQEIELAIDPRTGMKNYIANESLGIGTSSGYVKYSLTRSIHFGRTYTSGPSGQRGRDADLSEALRCMGQALHTLEDIAAHTNYIELALREMGHRNVFPHTGSATEMAIGGRQAYPLVTGTFGMVDFIHSVLGEANDHFAQSEVDQLNKAMAEAQSSQNSAMRSGPDGGGGAGEMVGLLAQMPGGGSLAQQAQDLQQSARAQESLNAQQGLSGGPEGSRPAPTQTTFDGPPGASGGPPGPGIPGMSATFDPAKTIQQIMPILRFHDTVAKAVNRAIEKIPGLEKLVEKIMDTLTVFIMSLLAPFVRPIIDAVSKQVKAGSSGLVDASGRHQYEPWTDPVCTDPTHSLLSKDHFGNVLNPPAGTLAAAILKYAAPRVIYAWEHPDIPVEQVLNDICRVFHHPALRDRGCEVHSIMFGTVEQWARTTSVQIDRVLDADSVRNGKNIVEVQYAGESFIGSLGNKLTGGGGHAHGGGGGGLGEVVGGAQQYVGNTFQSALNSQFGGFLKPLHKVGQMTGMTREGDDFEAEIAQTAGSSGMLQPPGGGGPDMGPGGYGYGDPTYSRPPPSPQPQFGYSYGAPPQQGSGYGGDYSGQPPAPGAYGYYPPQQGGYGGPPQGGAAGGYYGGGSY